MPRSPEGSDGHTQDAFIQRALQQPAEDGAPDLQGAYQELYDDPGEPEPHAPLAIDATTAERRAWIAERAAAIDQATREDLGHRSARRADTIATGATPEHRTTTCAPAKPTAAPRHDRQERIDWMAERLDALNRQETPEAI